VTRFLRRRQPTLPPEVSALAEQLIAAGYKVTEPRLAVLEAAVAHGGAFTALDLEQQLAATGRSPGQASIFRALKLLVELGLLQRIHGVDECHRYTLCSGHAHRVVCTGCGRLAEFGDCEIDDLSARLERATGFRIQGHLLEFFGTCPRCLAAG
jgi:Fur family transcriptional regulator, ferric uptake regulator